MLRLGHLPKNGCTCKHWHYRSARSSFLETCLVRNDAASFQFQTSRCMCLNLDNIQQWHNHEEPGPEDTVPVKMNDLAGLDWNAASTTPKSYQPQSQPQYSAYKPVSSPATSRSSTPVLSQTSGTSSKLPPRTNGSSKTQGLDSFAGLLGPGSSRSQTSSLSLQERQKQLFAERAKQTTGSTSQTGAQHHAVDSQFWEGLGSGRGTPVPVGFEPVCSLKSLC